MKYLKKFSIYICIAFSLLLLSGCGKIELFSRLKEKEANEMMATLLDKGIDVSKEEGKEETYILLVDEQDFSVAVDILKKYGYPRDDYEGIGVVFQKSGLVSTPSEERIRFMHALSQELERTISSIDGVVNSRVHVVLPENNPFMEASYPASASIFINHRPDSNVENSVPKIKNLVMNGVEGLAYENISLVLFPANIDEVSIRNRISGKNVNKRMLGLTEGELIALGGGLVFLFAGTLSYLMFSFYKKRKKAVVDIPMDV